MDHQQRSLRFGASVVLCALLLRLAGTGFFRPVAEFLAKPNIAAFLIYLETGRIVRFSPSDDALEVFAFESAMPDFALEALSAEETTALPVFSAADAETVTFKNSGGSVIITTHDTSELSACDDIYLLKDGRLVSYDFDGDVERLARELL